MEEHPQARFIVETLAKAGFIAYYAGGWVRDYLLQHPSDDIDIATNAPPETIQALFSHTVPIGIAFGIILVIIDGHEYEVATFRQDLDYKDGRRPSRVEFSTPIEDAKRRDFTINGMFYDPLKSEILDFVGGRADLEKKIIRAIGDPHERIREDRLRMVRACRLSCRFNFPIDPATEKAIRAHAKELFPAVAVERIWQEFTKGHAFGKLSPMLLLLHNFDLLAPLFPSLASLPLSELEKRLTPTTSYPKEAPVIATILALFPNANLAESISLCQRLKLSTQEINFVTLLFRARTLPSERVAWVYFYATPSALLILHILAAPLDIPKREAFLTHHKEQMDILHRSIERIRTQNPVVKSEDLFRLGISPGPAMGKLLKEAERISIEDQLFDPAPILAQLKTSPLWP